MAIEEIKLHWWLITIRESNCFDSYDKTDVFATTTKNVKKSIIDHYTKDDMIILHLSYLGHMSEEEFCEEK